MTEEEQKATGFPSDLECLQTKQVPAESVLGYDPFLIKVDRRWDELTNEGKINASRLEALMTNRNGDDN